MTQRARGDKSNASWDGMKAGFHAHVLVWERESLILPVADRLGLGPPHPTSYRHQGAAGWLAERWREKFGGTYGKGTTGLKLLMQIADDPEALETVLRENPSVKTIVDDLVAL